MQWTDRIKHFGTLGGSVTVNGDPESWALDKLSSEAVGRAIESALGAAKFPTPQRWRHACATLQDVEEPEEFKRRLNAMVAMVDGTTRPIVPPPCAMNLLGALRLHRVLLWPIVLHSLPHVCPGAKAWHVKHGMTEFEQHFLARGQSERRLVGCVTMALSCSPINSADDISDAAIRHAVEVASQSTNWLEWRQEHRGLTFLQLIEHMPRSDGSVVSVVLPIQEMLYARRLLGINVPRYGGVATRTDASPWVELFDRYSASSKKKSSMADDQAFKKLLEFLATFGPIPAPSALTRAAHILGPNGFLKWLGGCSDVSGRGYASVVRTIHTMLASVHAGENREVLLHVDDIPPTPGYAGKSDKAVLPRTLVEMACNICRELIAVAFSQFDELSDKHWVAAGFVPVILRQGELWDPGYLPKTLLLQERFKKLFVTIRGVDGTLRQIVNPVHAIVLLWLLRMPARGLESTLLDSGEADEFLPEVREENDRHEVPRAMVEMRRNTHPLATKGRQLGAICMIPDPGSGAPVPGFYLNTRKRPVIAAEDWNDGGRVIPWSDPEMLLLFNRLLKWQQRLNPVDRLIARNEIRNRILKASDGLRGKLTGFCYLFRCLEDRVVGNRLEPISKQQLHSFFKLVLDEVEARLRSDCVALPQWIPADRPELSGVSLRTAFSLHCLRVTGITALVEEGLPFWIISEILAGHESWIMTQAYNKVSPTRVRDALARAQSRMEDGTLEREALKAARMPEEELKDSFTSTEKAPLAEGAQIAGFWLPMIDGICPNGATRCHEGGRCVDGSTGHGPVEGGARNCGLCRFFLTGERFIPGQIVMINGLLHQARRQARSLQELWVQRRGERGSGRGRRIDDRVAHAEVAIDVTFRTLNARVRLLRKSEALAAAAPAGDEAASGGDLLITRLDQGQVAASMRKVSELGFLDEVSRVAALVPELDIQDAPIERDALIDRLLDQNGFDGLLYRLPSGPAHAAGNAFTDAVRGRAPAGTSPGDHLDAVAEGRMGLADVDATAIAAEMSRALGMRIELRRSGGSSLNAATMAVIEQPTHQGLEA